MAKFYIVLMQRKTKKQAIAWICRSLASGPQYVSPHICCGLLPFCYSVRDLLSCALIWEQGMQIRQRENQGQQSTTNATAFVRETRWNLVAWKMTARNFSKLKEFCNVWRAYNIKKNWRKYSSRRRELFFFEKISEKVAKLQGPQTLTFTCIFEA